MKTWVLLAICLLISSCNGQSDNSDAGEQGTVPFQSDNSDAFPSDEEQSSDAGAQTPPEEEEEIFPPEEEEQSPPEIFPPEEEEQSPPEIFPPEEEEQSPSVEESEEIPPAEEQEEQSAPEEELNLYEEEEQSGEGELDLGEGEIGFGEEEQLTEEEEEELDDFIEEVIAAHQFYRNFFGSPQLTWNYTLNASAYKWAQFNAENGTIQHSVALGAFDLYGENIAFSGPGGYYNSSGFFPFIGPPSFYVDLWGAEWKYFINGSVILDNNCSTTGNYASVGHFTQVIWKTSTSVGCGQYSVADGFTVMVCQYYPPGNRLEEPIY